MSFFHESAIIRSQCNGKSDSTDRLPLSKAYPTRQAHSFPSLSTTIRSSWAWAGDTLQAFRDGSTAKEEQCEQVDIEDRKQALYLRMHNAVSYEEWRTCACELDELEQNNTWKHVFECTEYEPHLVLERLTQLEEACTSCDVSRMLFLIRTSLSRDLGNMRNASLYTHSYVGTKDLIDRYITVALDTISTLVSLSESDRCDGLELKHILDQLLAARQAFGRSAVLFSGGATFGMNHIGVLRALWEAKLLPRIMSGASAGSIVCAVFCTRTDDELPALLESFPHGDFSVFDEPGHEEGVLQRVARFLKYGSFLDTSNLAKVVRAWLGDITFQEAYNRTRRILNICVSSAGVYELPRLLNYITAPNVLIWSAVTVSCSIPLLFSPFVLMVKDPLTGQPMPWNNFDRQYIDGSVDGDLPMTRLSEMFNVNHFIVSQVNPHVVPFLTKDDVLPTAARQRRRIIPRCFHAMTNLAKDEILHRMATLSELGVFPTSLTKIASVVKQKYSGDITIYPEIRYANFPRILKNPTAEFLLKACLTGERATWPKFSRIRNHCAIELALDAAIQTMRARVAFSPGHANIRYNNLSYHPSDSLANSAEQAPTTHQRRGSSGQELEGTKPSSRKRLHHPGLALRRARSLLTFVEPHASKRQDPITTHQGTEYQVNNYQNLLPPTGGGQLDAISDNDGGSDLPLRRRPEPPTHRTSWSGIDTRCSWPGHNPAQCRDSPCLASPPCTIRRKSAPSTDLVRWHSLNAKTVSPPPYHFLLMTTPISECRHGQHDRRGHY